MIYLTLFYEFFKTGLFAIGGGLATIPFLYDIAEKYGWFTKDFIGTMVAVAESTPGPIGINAATYAGYTTAGMFGGITATLGIVTPSIIIIILISKILDKFKDNTYVKSAFYGIRPAVMGMIGAVALEMIVLALLTKSGNGILGRIGIKELILFIALFAASHKIKVHPILWIAIAGLIGGLASF